MSIATNIKELRKRNHMTQKQLANKSGLAVITIQQYEAGKFNPKPDAVMKLCIGLNCKITDIIDDETQKYYRMFDSIKLNTYNLIAFETAIHKFQKKEELTFEEEQAITDYVESDQFNQEKEDIKQIARKAYDYILYKYSYSYASSEEELDKLQKRHQTESERERNIHIYDASIEITPEAMERLKEDAEAREILKKYESGEKILDSEYKKVIEYHNRMMERSKLLQDWLEWYKSTCEPLNYEGRKKVAEYAETLAETDKYAKPKEWFQGRMTKEEIENAVEAYLNDDNSQGPDTTSPAPPQE